MIYDPVKTDVDSNCFYVRNGKCFKNEPCHLHPLRRRLKTITVKAEVIKLPQHRGGLEVKIGKTKYVVDSDPKMQKDDPRLA